MTLQEKEEIILGTIFECNKHIENYLNNSYNHVGLINLYSDVSGVNFNNLMENTKLISDKNVIQPSPRNNPYSYFKEVENFLNNEKIIISSLNESFNQSSFASVKDSLKIDIFRSNLNAIISKLEKLNDIEKYDYESDILKNKILLNSPINILGFDIMQSLFFQNEIIQNFNLNFSDLCYILYCVNDKRIYFIFRKFKCVYYDIKTDTFGSENFTCSNKIDEINYNNLFREVSGFYTVTLYFNVQIANLKFTDNLYKDNAWLNSAKNNPHIKK